MKIYLTRHGQTRLNRAKLMQGRSDEPLNETGISQAEEARNQLLDADPALSFDAVYASPLQRAVDTAAIMGGVPKEAVRIDERLIETDFGPYEQKPYRGLGLRMSLYWALPELFPPPDGVESTEEMIRRVRSFLSDLQKQPEERVLIACHGGIMRVLSGCLAGRRRGYIWRPKPRNCEVRIYELDGNGKDCE